MFSEAASFCRIAGEVELFAQAWTAGKKRSKNFVLGSPPFAGGMKFATQVLPLRNLFIQVL